MNKKGYFNLIDKIYILFDYSPSIVYCNIGFVANSRRRKMETKSTIDIPVNEIREYSKQPRKYFNPLTLKQLGDSILEIGQLTPAKVRKLDPPEDGYKYELIAGERRLRACKMVGVPTLRAEVDYSIKNENQQYVLAVVENYGRDEPTPVESARSIGRLLDAGHSKENIAKLMCRSITWVYQHASLLKLHPNILGRIGPPTPESKQISSALGQILSDVPEQYQEEVIKVIIARQFSLLAAKHYIKKYCAGVGVRAQKTSVKREVKVISSSLVKMNDRLDIYLDMDQDQFKQIFRYSKLQNRMFLAEKLDELIGKATALKQVVDKILQTK